jgi:hypothetical protein
LEVKKTKGPWNVKKNPSKNNFDKHMDTSSLIL